jgi:hypothetical protein
MYNIPRSLPALHIRKPPPYRTEAMHNAGGELPRISIPRTWVNKGIEKGPEAERGLFVLILPAALALEPVLVLLAVGHGGAIEAIDLLLYLFVGKPISVIQVSVLQVSLS